LEPEKLPLLRPPTAQQSAVVYQIPRLSELQNPLRISTSATHSDHFSLSWQEQLKTRAAEMKKPQQVSIQSTVNQLRRDMQIGRDFLCREFETNLSDPHQLHLKIEA